MLSNDESSNSPCIITNETEAVTDYPAWSPPDENADMQLSNAWGLSPIILYPFIRGNQIRLKADFCQTYRSGNWALVPDITILDKIAAKSLTIEHSDGPWSTYLESFPQMERTYKFVHFCGSPGVFVRLNDDHPQNANSFELHKKPFENFPTIHSDVHPYFIIADVAQKVLHQRQDKIQVTEQPSAIQECLDLCIVIYRQWLSLTVKRAPVKSSRSRLSVVVKPRASDSSSARNQGRGKQGKRAMSDSDYEPPANKSLKASH